MTKTVYGVTRYTSASSDYKRHAVDVVGLPLCGARSSYSYELEDGDVTCKRCLTKIAHTAPAQPAAQSAEWTPAVGDIVRVKDSSEQYPIALIDAADGNYFMLDEGKVDEDGDPAGFWCFTSEVVLVERATPQTAAKYAGLQMPERVYEPAAPVESAVTGDVYTCEPPTAASGSILTTVNGVITAAAGLRVSDLPPFASSEQDYGNALTLIFNQEAEITRLRAAVADAEKRELACLAAARSLLFELSDGAIDMYRECAGNTNATALQNWRDKLREAVVNPTAYADETLKEYADYAKRAREADAERDALQAEKDAIAQGWHGFMQAVDEERREQYAQITALLDGLDNISPMEALTRLLSFRRTYTHLATSPKAEG